MLFLDDVVRSEVDLHSNTGPMRVVPPRVLVQSRGHVPAIVSTELIAEDADAPAESALDDVPVDAIIRDKRVVQES